MQSPLPTSSLPTTDSDHTCAKLQDISNTQLQLFTSMLTLVTHNDELSKLDVRHALNDFDIFNEFMHILYF